MATKKTTLVTVSPEIKAFLNLLAGYFGTPSLALSALLTTNTHFRAWQRRVVQCPGCQTFVSFTTNPATRRLIIISHHTIPNPSPDRARPARIQCPHSEKQIKIPCSRVSQETIDGQIRTITHCIDVVQPGLFS